MTLDENSDSFTKVLRKDEMISKYLSLHIFPNWFDFIKMQSSQVSNQIFLTVRSNLSF